jgi:hypothetical protein
MDEITISWGSGEAYTAYRFGSKDPFQQRDAVAAWAFFDKLPKYLEGADVVFGPNPPDFVIQVGAVLIGVELTQLNPKPPPRFGFQARGRHRTWKESNPTNSLPKDGSKVEFDWGSFSLREALNALREQVARKAIASSKYSLNYAENWLLLQCEEGSPFGNLAESSHLQPDLYRGDVLDFIAKESFEVERILAERTEFARIILFSGGGFVSVKNRQSFVRLPTLDQSLVARGAELGDDFLNWSFTIKSSRWRALE